MNNDKGFTLIEIICVLILISVIGAIAATKYDMLGNTAADRVADQVIQQMNTEAMDGWTKAKFATWVDDEQAWVFEIYTWANYQGGRSGGTLNVSGHKIDIRRNPSTSITPARWERK